MFMRKYIQTDFLPLLAYIGSPLLGTRLYPKFWVGDMPPKPGRILLLLAWTQPTSFYALSPSRWKVSSSINITCMYSWGWDGGNPEWKEVGLYIFSHKHTKYYNLVGSLCLENMILHLLPSTLSLHIQKQAVRVLILKYRELKLEMYHFMIHVRNPCTNLINVTTMNVTHKHSVRNHSSRKLTLL